MTDIQVKNLSTVNDVYEVDLSVAETSILAVVLCLIMFFDIVGNGVMATVVLRNKRMWTETNMFLMNLVFGDIAVSLLSMPVPLVTVIRREWIFERGPLCSLNAYCSSLFFVATIFTHTTISIDRYMACVKPMHKVITRKKATLMIMGVWILSAVISLGPLVGWGRNDYNASTLQCGFGFPRNKFETLYMLLLAVIAFIIPICIMTFAYIRTYLVVRKSSRRISTTTFGQQRQRNVELQKKIVITFFLALIAFIVCWTPFFAFIASAASSDTIQNIPRGLGVAAYWCGFLNSACNPFIIGLRNEQFKEAFRQFLCWPINCFRKTRKVDDRISLSQRTLTRTEDFIDGKKKWIAPSSDCPLPQNKTETVASFVTLSNSAITNDSCDGQIIAHKSIDLLTNSQTKEKGQHNPQQKARKTGRQEMNHVSISYEIFLHHIGEKVWRESGV